MPLKHITCQNLIRTITTPDQLFHGTYTLDPYQNCAFACNYCDSSYDPTIYIKTNAATILQQELQTLPPGRIIIGSVHDPYQPCEEHLSLTRSLIQISIQNQFPIHILTKSPLVLRDIDLIKQNPQNLVTISIITRNPHIYHLFEPHTPTPKQRFKILTTLHTHQITSGIALIPILPYLVEDELDSFVQTAKHHHAQYLLYKHLELKGKQKHDILTLIAHHFPTHLAHYNQEYHNNYAPSTTYQHHLTHIMHQLHQQYHIPLTLPKTNTKT